MVRVGLDKELGVVKVETEEKRHLKKMELINLVVAMCGIFFDPACQRSAQTCCTQGRLSEAGSQQSEEAEAQARAAEAEQEG